MAQTHSQRVSPFDPHASSASAAAPLLRQFLHFGANGLAAAQQVCGSSTPMCSPMEKRMTGEDCRRWGLGAARMYGSQREKWRSNDLRKELKNQIQNCLGFRRALGHAATAGSCS
jgi:hypothetical protein